MSTDDQFVRAASLTEVPDGARKVIVLDGHVIVLFNVDGRIFAVDNRCPHMGFPLDRGTVKDCVLTCHWHHARFDLTSGGTFDQWADNLRAYPVKTVHGEVWVDLAERTDLHSHRLNRLRDGLERNIPLVIAKSSIALMDRTNDAMEAFRAGVEFGVHYRHDGWGAGLTTLTCMMNLLPALAPDDRPLALFHGLASVADDTDGNAPHFQVRPQPNSAVDLSMLKRWLRGFVEVRDAEGAERCIVSAVRAGYSPREVADMLFAAATDHRYLSIGHVLDFTNKAFEALDHAGWDLAEPVLSSLARGYANADRMEESNAWRNPTDLIAILESAFESIPAALEAGARAGRRGRKDDELVGILLDDDPSAIAEAMLSALRDGCVPDELAGQVAYASALRIARFPTSNEFGDWDTAHHSFTFAAAVHRALQRASSPELLRAVFDAAMSVYLDRFLNVPAVKVPGSKASVYRPRELLDQIPALLDRQHQVNQAGELVAEYLETGGEPDALRAAIGHLLLREDRDFHSIQNIEAAFSEFTPLIGTEAGTHLLIATARYLAAHSPTMRAQGQTYQIALRLHRGERLFGSD
jgi:nitrite reductase/ring-hydroxylating ferredoxin subunit